MRCILRCQCLLERSIRTSSGTSRTCKRGGVLGRLCLQSHSVFCSFRCQSVLKVHSHLLKTLLDRCRRLCSFSSRLGGELSFLCLCSNSMPLLFDVHKCGMLCFLRLHGGCVLCNLSLQNLLQASTRVRCPLLHCCFYCCSVLCILCFQRSRNCCSMLGLLRRQCLIKACTGARASLLHCCFN
jgi:hypothetical protein